MDMSFISVIIPTHNRAHILGRAIQSVLDQTFKDFELIVIDDGSSDHTRGLVASYLDPRIRYIYQENAGVCAARNHAANEAKGEYLVFLDSDDYLYKECLCQYYNVAKQQNAGLLFSNMVCIDVKTKTQSTVDARKPKEYGTGNFVAGAFCVSRNLFIRVGGYDTKLTFAENSELSYRLWNSKPVIGFTDKVGLIYEVSLDGGSKNLHNIISSSIYIIKKHTGNSIFKPRIKRFFFQNAAIAALRLKCYKQGRELLWKAFIQQPWKLKTLIKLFIAFFPSVADYIWKPL